MGIYDKFIPQSPADRAPGPDAAAEAKTGPAEPAVGLPQSIAAALGNGMMLGAGPYIAGASEYTSNLGAPGSFDRGKQQYIEQQTVAHDSNPVAYNISDVAGGFLTPMPVGGARAAVLGTEMALRGAGPIVRAAAIPAAGLAAVKAAPAGLWAAPLAAGATYRGVRGVGVRLSRMGESLRDSRVARGAARDARRVEQTAPAAGRVEPQFAEPPPPQAPSGPTGPVNLPPRLADALRRSVEAPAPGSGTLSAEMRAALNRRKFRHDYSTGEWADLLAPGE